MKYEIKHSCGCTETVDIFGTNVHGERDRKVERLESKPCRKCAHANDGEELTGSDKQISWAQDIRHEMSNELDTLHAWATKNAKCDEHRKQFDDNFAVARENMAKITEARWFIDNRDLKSNKLFIALYNL